MFRQLLTLLALGAFGLLGSVGVAHANPPPYASYGYTPGSYDDEGPTRMSASYAPSSGFGNAPYSRYGYTPGAYDNSGPSYSSGYSPSYAQPSSFASGYSYGASFAGSSSGSEQAAPDRKVHIDMRLPADAKVWFNGKEVRSSGAWRRFESPVLNEDGNYTYNLRVAWKNGARAMEQARRVIVHPGDHLALNFPAASVRSVEAIAQGK